MLQAHHDTRQMIVPIAAQPTSDIWVLGNTPRHRFAARMRMAEHSQGHVLGCSTIDRWLMQA